MFLSVGLCFAPRLVLSWDCEVLDDALSGAVHDESITEFVLKVTPLAPVGKATAKTLRSSFAQALAYAEAWRDGESSATSALLCPGSVCSFLATVPGLSTSQRYVCQAGNDKHFHLSNVIENNLMFNNYSLIYFRYIK